MDKLISVVIPVYNQEKYIRECLDSLFPQCTDEVEVILVDDGSKDQSAAICRDYVSRYPETARLIDQENSGVMKTRINGVREARGEYILFVDSDDVPLEHALDTLLQTLKEKRYDLVLFNATCDQKAHKPLFKVPLKHGQELTGQDKEQVYALLCGTDTLNNLWTKCIRRELFLQSPLPDVGHRLTNGEDLYQILDLADQARSIVYLDRVLYYYRVMPNGASRVYNPYYFPSEKIVCAKRIEYAKKWGKGDALVPGARVQTYKIMREIARKVLISNMSWKEIKEETRRLRNDAFFKEYYLNASDAPDHRDLVLKAPLPVMYMARLLYKFKSKVKGA